MVALSGAYTADEIKLGLAFVPQPLVEPTSLAKLLQKEPDKYRLLPSGRLTMTLPVAAPLSPMEFLRAVREAVGGLPVLAVRG